MRILNHELHLLFTQSTDTDTKRSFQKIAKKRKVLHKIRTQKELNLQHDFITQAAAALEMARQRRGEFKRLYLVVLSSSGLYS